MEVCFSHPLVLGLEQRAAEITVATALVRLQWQIRYVHINRLEILFLL